MSDFKIKTTWIPTEENDILKKTLAYLLIRVKDCTLTRNVNTWDNHKHYGILHNDVVLQRYCLSVVF